VDEWMNDRSSSQRTPVAVSKSYSLLKEVISLQVDLLAMGWRVETFI